MFCFFCKKEISFNRKIGFRELCPYCDQDLHICKNCTFFDEKKPHHCRILDIEPVTDSEKNNFCEEFSPASSPIENKSSPSDNILGKLPKNRSFNDLFSSDDDDK